MLVKRPSVAILFVDCGAIIEAFRKGLDRLEKSGQKEEMLKQLSTKLPIKALTKFFKSQIFIPDGKLWFSFYSTMDFGFHLTGKFVPQSCKILIEPYIAKLGKKIKILKNDLELYELLLTDKNVNAIFRVSKDEIFLMPSFKSFKQNYPDEIQKELLKKIAREKPLLTTNIWFNQLNKSYGEYSCKKEFEKCFLAQKLFTEYYSTLEGEEKKEVFDDLSLSPEMTCPKGAQFVLRKDGLGFRCLIHGHPQNNDINESEKYQTRFLEPYKDLDIMILAQSASFTLALNDSNTANLLEEKIVTYTAGRKIFLNNNLKLVPEELREDFINFVNSWKLDKTNNILSFSARYIDPGMFLGEIGGFVSYEANQQIPVLRKKRDEARQKACMATRRVIQGAIEMYNLDNSEPMKTLNIDLLLEKGYLRKNSYGYDCPVGGKFEYLQKSETDFTIRCSECGNID